MRILILGATGMLGHTLLFEFLSLGMDVFGTARNKAKYRGLMPDSCLDRLIDGVDALQTSSLERAIAHVKPSIVINCVGLIRQKPEGREPLPCIEVNARLPHLLLAICRHAGCRLIHYSTDCVFDGGKKGLYVESDPCSAKDVYGLSKYLGEISGPSALTLRTSIIGHELASENSLLEWFLHSEGEVRGYTKALYSGLTAVEHASALARHVLPNDALHGLYHLSSSPISKHDLLGIVAEKYGKTITIIPNDSVIEDKRLSGDLFRRATGYSAPAWPDMVAAMRDSWISYEKEKGLVNE